MNKLKASALNTGRTHDVNNDLDEQTLYITKLGKMYPRYWSVRDSYCQPLILGQCLISAGVSSKPYNWTITRSESCEFILSTL